ncbi:hypothetical protein Tco_1364280, partial [Tanacetum coccineum]
MKPENFEAKDVGGMIKKGKLDNPKQESLEPRADETLYRLTKSAHFFPMRESDSIDKLTRLYHLGKGLSILANVGTIAYRLKLPQQLSRVHSTFHVSNLKKCLSDEPLAIPLDEIHIDDKLYFVKEPVEIIDHEVKRLNQI